MYCMWLMMVVLIDDDVIIRKVFYENDLFSVVCCDVCGWFCWCVGGVCEIVGVVGGCVDGGGWFVV